MEGRMAQLTITWQDPDEDHPAQDVVVRLVAFTDRAHDAGDISAYLMERGPDQTWAWSADVPSDLRTSYQICPVRDRPLRGQPLDENRWAEVVAAGEPDPSCPDSMPAGCIFGNPRSPASVLSMPHALAQPWAVRLPSVPRGSFTRTHLKGGSLVHVYRSSQAPDSRTPLLVIFDGQRLLATDVSATFDNLVGHRILEPLTAIVVESIHGSAPTGPSRIASLTGAPELEAFIIDELLPAVETRHPITGDPTRRALVGHSLGAVAALHVATQRPDLFGSVVAGSPALWWPGENGQVCGADVAAAYRNTPRIGRLFLDVGTE
jgi:enterochelin esterase-like enzyme